MGRAFILVIAVEPRILHRHDNLVSTRNFCVKKIDLSPLHRFAHEDRDVAAGASPVVGVRGIVLVAEGPEVRLLVGGGDAGAQCHLFSPMTDLDVGGLHEIEIPGGIARRAALRGDQEYAVVVGDVH
jgi:hypothetical protein